MTVGHILFFAPILTALGVLFELVDPLWLYSIGGACAIMAAVRYVDDDPER